MREILKKATTFTRIEFWVLTTIFAFVIFFFISNGLNHDQPPYEDADYYANFKESHTYFNFYRNYFFPQLIRHLGLYAALIVLNFIIIPGLIKRQSVLKNVILFLLVFGLLVCIYSITATWLFSYRYTTDTPAAAHEIFLRSGLEHAWITIWALGIYTAIKYAGIYLLAISETIEAKYKYMKKEAIVGTVVWLAGLLFLNFGAAEEPIIAGWGLVIPTGIAFYLFSCYKLIPKALSRKRFRFMSYLLKCMVLLFATYLVLYYFMTAISGNEDTSAEYSAFNSFFQLFVTLPITWMVYKRQLKGNETINVLQSELKRSSASVDFLRSQINPHFLFNALNTLYGTALQENAERTSEGIQKLGDMMRFMLQENMQDKISLTREIDYLENYIALQKLRTDANPIVQIQTDIQASNNFFQIAPMLLIPFVENAFKHGISFREPSYIKVTLQILDGTLYFDVSNSKHARPDNDPEKDKSGIGLENVKQRLQLAYPGKHELIIRDHPKEFFIHLSVQLAKLA
jgi:two-component system, LytTR family, sensor kinase